MTTSHLPLQERIKMPHQGPWEPPRLIQKYRGKEGWKSIQTQLPWKATLAILVSPKGRKINILNLIFSTLRPTTSLWQLYTIYKKDNTDKVLLRLFLKLDISKLKQSNIVLDSTNNYFINTRVWDIAFHTNKKMICSHYFKEV